MRRPIAFLLWLLPWLLGPAIASAQVIKSGPPACPAVALTFDLCPVRKGPGYDQALVEYLIEHRIPATFFMSGKWMARHDEQVEHLLGIGFFDVGTHGEAHAHLPLHSADEQREEISRPVTLLQEHYAHESTLFRPPYGEYNDVTVGVVKALGLRFIQWSIESGDPDPSLSTEQILARVTKRVKPGSIVVFHANGKGKQTRDVIERLTTDVLPQKNLKPVTVSELLNCKPAP
ncbi:polysaccharide deacetylase family protein [Nitrospira moscoviensis]|uniref:Putative Polysaccharide deacetylase n=1 Tax=Nitrospira moscoviensis TaxID=42253 RepID=A0A0K2G8P8_NITMO|nr:polysaccharide deacetylase family protein [Nitrospira moscoviensis]ALA56962.1 putative Polysaccharide deacetylase [Nitrospira moscoviensis]